MMVAQVTIEVILFITCHLMVDSFFLFCVLFWYYLYHLS